jgi:hypothetical protein
MTNPKKYKFFKVKYSEDLAVVLEVKTPITLKEARERCEIFYGHSNGFCVSISDKFVLDIVKDLDLIEASLHKTNGFTFGTIFSVKRY